MNPEKLTVKSGEAVNEAVGMARRAGNPVVYDLHLLLALLAQDEGIVVPVLQKLGVSVTALRARAEQEVGRYPKQSDAQPNLSRELNQIFDRAEKEAKEGLPPPVFVAGPFFRLAKSNAGFLMLSLGGGIEGVDVEDVVDFGDAIGISLPGTGE